MGFVIYFNSNLISWSSRKLWTVASSSTKAKYKVIATCASEIMWLKSLLCEIRFPIETTYAFWCDNLSATYLTMGPIFHSRCKHLEIDFHFVRDQVQQRLLKVRYLSSMDQIADVLIKLMSKNRFLLLKDKLAVFANPVRLEGR